MNRSQASVKSAARSEISIIKDEFNHQTPAEKLKILNEMEEIMKTQNFENIQIAKDEVKTKLPRNRLGR